MTDNVDVANEVGMTDEEIAKKQFETLDRRAEKIVYSFLKAKNTPSPAEAICYASLVPVYMAKYMSMMMEDVNPMDILNNIKGVIDTFSVAFLEPTEVPSEEGATVEPTEGTEE